MIELLALIGALVVGFFLFKILIAVLGVVFKILIVPAKLLLGLFLGILLLPLFVLFLPVMLVLGIGLAAAFTAVCGLFAWVWAA